MELVLQNITKSYERKVLFSDLNLTFAEGKSYSIIGKNGSGKTTLLKVIMGFSKPDIGSIYWKNNIQLSPISYTDFSFAGIQQQLFEDLTIDDIVRFHFKFRTPISNTYHSEIGLFFPSTMLSKKANQLSAGWLNRLKLVLAILTESKVLILDEPFSNLDDEGIEKFSQLIKKYSLNRILIVAGNRIDEISLCENKINLSVQ